MRHPLADHTLEVIPVLPAAHRPPRLAPDGACDHPVTWLYGLLYQDNARAKRLRELGAPAEVQAKDDVASCRRSPRCSTIRLCSNRSSSPTAGALPSLATMLATEDLACLESIVFALGFELVP